MQNYNNYFLIQFIGNKKEILLNSGNNKIAATEERTNKH